MQVWHDEVKTLSAVSLRPPHTFSFRPKVSDALRQLLPTHELVRCLVEDFVEGKQATLRLPPTDRDMRELTAYVVKRLGYASETELNQTSAFHLAALRAFFIVSIVHKNIETGKGQVDSGSSDEEEDMHKKNDTYVRQYGVNPCWESGDSHEVRKRSRLVSSVVDFYIPKERNATQIQASSEIRAAASASKNGALASMVNGSSNGVNAASKHHHHWTEIPHLRSMAQRCSIPISMPRSTLSSQYPAVHEASTAAVAAASVQTDSVLITKSVSAALNGPPLPPGQTSPHTAGPISARRMFYRYADMPPKKASVSSHGRVVDVTATSHGHGHGQSQGHGHGQSHGHGHAQSQGHGHGQSQGHGQGQSQGHSESRRGTAGLSVEGGERNVLNGGKHAAGAQENGTSSPKLQPEHRDPNVTWKSLFLYNVLDPAQKAAASLGVHPRMLDMQARKKAIRMEEEDTLEQLRRRLAAEEDPKRFSARVVKLNNNLDVIADDVTSQMERRANTQIKAGSKTHNQAQNHAQNQIQTQYQTQSQTQTPRALGKFKMVSGMLIRFSSQRTSLDASFSGQTDSGHASPLPKQGRSFSSRQASPRDWSIVQAPSNRALVHESREDTPTGGDSHRGKANMHVEKRGVLDSESMHAPSPRSGIVRLNLSQNPSANRHHAHAPVAQRESSSLNASDARLQTRQNAAGQIPRETNVSMRGMLNGSQRDKGMDNSEGAGKTGARPLHIHTGVHVVTHTAPDHQQASSSRAAYPPDRGAGGNMRNFPQENDGIQSAVRAQTERGRVRGNDDHRVDATDKNNKDAKARARSAKERDHVTGKDPRHGKVQTDRRRYAHADTDANGRLRDGANNSVSGVKHEEVKKDGHAGSLEGGLTSGELDAVVRVKHTRNQGPSGRVWVCRLPDTHGVFTAGQDGHDSNKTDHNRPSAQVRMCLSGFISIYMCMYVY
jgi:hypothetical protein